MRRQPRLTNLDEKELWHVNNAEIERTKYFESLNMLTKCVYESEWLPCEYCTSHQITAPCRKLRGPKTAAHAEPSRPIPTADDAVIRTEDALLLDYAYSNNDLSQAWAKSLFNVMATQYGPSISSRSLRHTILALCASFLPQTQFGDSFFHHKAEAYRALSRVVQTPRTITEADVLAACFLAQLCASGDVVELSQHAHGCLEMLRVSYENVGGNPLSNMHIVFGPYASQVCEYYAIISSLSPRARQIIPRRHTTFHQRVSYWTAIHHFKHKSEKWLTGSVRSINEILRDLINLLLSCINRVALMETGQQSEAGTLHRDILEYIKEELGDADFRKAMENIRRKLQTFTGEEKSLENAMMRYQLVKLDCVNMGLDIFLSSVLMEGVQSVASRASAWFRSYRSQKFEEKFMYCYGESNCVLLGGLLLPVEEVEEGEFILSFNG